MRLWLSVEAAQLAKVYGVFQHVMATRCMQKMAQPVRRCAHPIPIANSTACVAQRSFSTDSASSLLGRGMANGLDRALAGRVMPRLRGE
jgi:hypothetical protein